MPNIRRCRCFLLLYKPFASLILCYFIYFCRVASSLAASLASSNKSFYSNFHLFISSQDIFPHPLNLGAVLDKNKWVKTSCCLVWVEAWICLGFCKEIRRCLCNEKIPREILRLWEWMLGAIHNSREASIVKAENQFRIRKLENFLQVEKFIKFIQVDIYNEMRMYFKDFSWLIFLL